jgi:antitoxin HicB
MLVLDLGAMATSHEFEVVLAPEKSGGYSVSVPALPGCTSQGETREEALTMIREAIEVYLESLSAHGDPLPAPIEIERVTVVA